MFCIIGGQLNRDFQNVKKYKFKIQSTIVHIPLHYDILPCNTSYSYTWKQLFFDIWIPLILTNEIH